MSQILDFYRGQIKHPKGLTLTDILYCSNDAWEHSHDFVQWLFPLPEPSAAVPDAPVATAEDFQVFRDDFGVRGSLRASVARYEQFLRECEGWKRPGDHNHLRITRVIRCMVLAGMPRGAEDFLCEVYHLLGPAVADIPARSLVFWKEALNEKPAWLKG